MNSTHSSSFPSPKNTSINVFYAGFALLVVLFLGSSFHLEVMRAKASLYLQLETISKTASLSLDTDKVRQLAEEIRQGDRYQINSIAQQQLQTDLQELQAKHRLQNPLQLVLLDSKKESEALLWPPPSLQLSDAQSKAELLLAQSEPESSQVTTSGSQMVLNYLAPIRDENRKLAFLKANMSYDKNHLLWKALQEMPWLNLSVFLMLFTLGFVYTLNTFSKKQQQDASLREQLISRQQEVATQNMEIKAQDEWIRQTLEELQEAKAVIEDRNKQLTVLNKILDIKIQRRTEELEKTTMELSTFLYRSSHDIMGPIATLKGLCNLARSEITEHKGQNYIRLVSDTVEQLSHTIRNIAVVFEIRNRPLNFQSVSLNEFVHTVFNKQLKQTVLTESQLEVLVPQTQKVITDAYLLETILSELFKNALNALQIRKMQVDTLQHRAFIQVSSEMDKEKLTLLISDNGTGLSKALQGELNKLFLQKAHAKNKGYGMGLYVVKSAVERLKGQILIREKHEQGALFQLSLPIRD